MLHLTSINDLSKEKIIDIFDLTATIKKKQEEGIEHSYLKNKTLGMIFQKSSTRTRVSFEVGMYQLGGNALFLGSNDIQLGRGETIEDTAQVLSRYLDGIMLRTSAHKNVIDFAANSSVPVINGLSDLQHPCQALADIFTLKEIFGELLSVQIAYIGDGNNVANSLVQLCSILGIDINIACPEGYSCNKGILTDALSLAHNTGSQIKFFENPEEAVQNCNAVYTDTWISMGMEKEKEERIKAFKGYTVDSTLMSYALQNAVFMHCLPAYREYEVTSEVLDSPQSVVLVQAENRLHVQKAIMTYLMSSAGEYSWNY